MVKKVKLKRHLGLTELVFFGIGAIVGTGIFVMPAIVANIAGVGSIFVWIELGLLTIFMALCLAELASIHPDAGGPYIFVREAFGKLAGFIAGWAAWIVSWVTIASLAVAVSYGVSYFHHLSRSAEVLVAVATLVLITFMNIKGMHWGLKAQYVLTTLSVLVLWMFITWGVYFINIKHFIAPPTVPITLPDMLVASVLVVEPFIGWETVTYFAEDAINPTRDVPRAIIYSSIFVTLIYVAVIFVALGLTDAYHLGASKFPLASAATTFLGPRGASVIAIGGIIVLLGCLNSWIIGTARLPFALARDGLFPKFLHQLHGKHGTPHMSLLLQLVFACAAVLLGGFEEIIRVLVCTVMLYLYLPTFLSILVHRKKAKEIPYRLPLGYLVVAIASALAVFVVIYAGILYVALSTALIVMGLPVYFYMIRER